MTVAAAAASAPRAPAVSHHPLLGVAAVLVGAFLSTINVRLTTVGLADIRGGLALGFDEGSWVATVFAAAQMVVCPWAAWLGGAVGTRRFLLWSASIFCISSALPPLTRDPELLMALQLVRGLAVGTFIPCALGFILRSLPPRLWGWGLAAYCFRFVFSQNITTSLEALYGEDGRWDWIFWQNTALTPIMIVLIWFGIPREPVNRDLLRRADWGGIALAGLGFGLIYAALDQGNRLDWLNSGMIVGLLAAGGLLVAAFLVTELLVPEPLIHLPVLRHPNIAIPFVMIAVYGFGVTATAFVLPDYLGRVQGLRAQQIGDALNWIALPQLVLVPVVALLLRWLDARLLFALGLALIAYGSWMDTGLTHDWANDDFLPAQLVEAVGLAFGITALVFFSVANITPAQAAPVAALIQISRLLGNEAGGAFMQTFVRIREQLHSHLLGLHVVPGADLTERTTTQLTQLFADRSSAAAAAGQSLGTLAGLVRREAYVLAYVDGFWIIAWVLALSLILLLLLSPPPLNPLTPPRRQA